MQNPPSFSFLSSPPFAPLTHRTGQHCRGCYVCVCVSVRRFFACVACLPLNLKFSVVSLYLSLSLSLLFSCFFDGWSCVCVPPFFSMVQNEKKGSNNEKNGDFQFMCDFLYILLVCCFLGSIGAVCLMMMMIIWKPLQEVRVDHLFWPKIILICVFLLGLSLSLSRSFYLFWENVDQFWGGLAEFVWGMLERCFVFLSTSSPALHLLPRGTSPRNGGSINRPPGFLVCFISFNSKFVFYWENRRMDIISKREVLVVVVRCSSK